MHSCTSVTAWSATTGKWEQADLLPEDGPSAQFDVKREIVHGGDPHGHSQGSLSRLGSWQRAYKPQPGLIAYAIFAIASFIYNSAVCH